MMKDLSHLDK
jgi:hypothetical protein